MVTSKEYNEEAGPSRFKRGDFNNNNESNVKEVEMNEMKETKNNNEENFGGGRGFSRGR